MKLGVHISTAGGIDKSVEQAMDFGCNTFQIFISNPRGWKPTKISEETIKSFLAKRNEAKIEEIFGHSIYLINLATDNIDNLENSKNSLISALSYASKLGLSGIITHIGSHGGVGIEKGIERVVEAIEMILEQTPEDSMLLLENTAGAGNLVGDKFEEIGEIIRKVNSPRLGICMDTAHTFENGYPIHTSEGLEEVLDKIDREIGLDRLKAIHLNDSMTDFNSHRDRHENFGHGYIGEAALTRIINHPKLKNKPFIMETPEIKGEDGIKKTVEYVRSLSS